MSIARICLIAAGLFLAACVGDLAHLVTLQKSLLAEYPGTEITVSVNGRNSLSVEMVNGAATGLSGAQEAELARAVGMLVLERYQHAHQLETISVKFGTAARGPIAITRETTHHQFTPAELLAAEPAPVELVESAAVTY